MTLVQRSAADGLQWTALPRWYLWDGGFLALGRTEGIVPAHSHHALQITIAIEGSVALGSEGGDWREGPGAIVRQDAVHRFDGKGASGAMLFVDPESSEGAWLGASLTEDITLIPQSRLEDSTAALRLLRETPVRSDVGALVRRCVTSLCSGEPPERRRDERITAALDAIRAADDLRMSLEDAAATVFLSPSRFAHLFAEQVGLPFRRYVLWRKVTRAMAALAREETIAAAAYAGGFADAAHLTRTFQQMFGLAPSVMMRGELVEIPSPFA